MITLKWEDGTEVEVDGPVPNVGDTVEVGTGNDRYEQVDVVGRTFVYGEGWSLVRLDVAPVVVVPRRQHRLTLVATGLIAALFPSGHFWGIFLGA